MPTWLWFPHACILLLRGSHPTETKPWRVPDVFLGSGKLHQNIRVAFFGRKWRGSLAVRVLSRDLSRALLWDLACSSPWALEGVLSPDCHMWHVWAVLKVSTLKNSGVHSTDVENLSESPTPEPDPESSVPSPLIRVPCYSPCTWVEWRLAGCFLCLLSGLTSLAVVNKWFYITTTMLNIKGLLIF